MAFSLVPSCFHGYLASSSFSSTQFFTPSLSCGLSTSSTISKLRTCVKFEKFQGDSPLEQTTSASTSPASREVPLEAADPPEEEGEEDDDCLPNDLVGAVRQSGEASASFVNSGGTRAIVELLIPQLQFLDDEGAQAELWELSRVFVETLIKETGCERVKAVFPDAGAAALLKYKWKDAAFGFASLSDRKPVEKEDEIIVMIVPDYQMLEYVEKIAKGLADDPPRPLVMWNPRLISEEVGVGFNVRKLRRYFLSSFTTVYSMRPLAAGAVFRCYPGKWKVFYDNKDRPGRYLLAKELIGRPDAEDLEIIYGNVEEKPDEEPSLLSQAAGIFSSINRFMKAM
ncbi:DUF1995 domain protein [Hirschfeldia incana]|nr:DUF1995 domain protein [Hirschfeldia incana]